MIISLLEYEIIIDIAKVYATRVKKTEQDCNSSRCVEIFEQSCSDVGLSEYYEIIKLSQYDFAFIHLQVFIKAIE